MIQVQDISHSYDGVTQIQFPNFELKQAEKMLLLGQSGCGKTTLLHILGGILTPTKGKVIVDGVDMAQLSPSKRDSFRGKNIGIVFQKTHFVRSLSVLENLLLCQRLGGVATNKEDILRILSSLHVEHKIHSKPQQLSQGEQQRVAIARALVNQPQLILADEPTSALDDKNTREVIQLLEQQAVQNNATLIIVTHDTRLKDHFKNKIEL